MSSNRPSETIERLTFKGGAERNALQEATLKLHRERYTFAATEAAGKRVLDIACGVGYGSAMLKEAGATEVFGVDLAPEAIEEAVATFAAPGITFAEADYRKLKEKQTPGSALATIVAGGFDMIVSLETIEHMPNPDDFLKTILPLLKPGGLFFGSVPVTPSMDANPFHLNDFSPASFRRLLTSNGLEPLDHQRQVQKFNPISVKKEMADGQRHGLRQNMVSYYLMHPNKGLLRVYSTLRYGFVNLYDTVKARKAGK